MEPERIKRLFPNASQSTIDVNRLPSGAEPEQAVHNRAHGKVKGKTGHARRYAVSITSYRTRSTDPDNLVGKYFVDALRYSGLLHDDRAEDITYEISQKKVENKSQEKTLIVIL